MTSFDLFTFGETMIRLSSSAGDRLETATALDLRIGGTESNVAVALARIGRKAAWGSVLPRNALGRRIAGELQRHGVNVGAVHWASSGRVGVYFLDTGVAPRATQVVYDRRDSAVAQLDPDQIDLDLVERARILHLTGITPALSDGCAELCRRLIARARSSGVTVSFDVNYRSLLWSPEQAAEVLDEFCSQADILFSGQEDARTLWNIETDPETATEELSNRFGATHTVMTLGDQGSLLRTSDGVEIRGTSLAVTIVDPIGAGDAFAAGFLHGYLDGDLGRAIQLGGAMAALKMTMHGDLALITPEEVQSALNEQRRGIIR